MKYKHKLLRYFDFQHALVFFSWAHRAHKIRNPQSNLKEILDKNHNKIVENRETLTLMLQGNKIVMVYVK